MTFQPGETGNPGGRPKTAKMFRDALMTALKKTDGDVEKIQKIADALTDKAAAGDVQAIKEVADRIDGKVPQAVVGDEDHPPVSLVQRIERIIVDPSNSHAKSIQPAPSAGEI